MAGAWRQIVPFRRIVESSLQKEMRMRILTQDEMNEVFGGDATAATSLPVVKVSGLRVTSGNPRKAG